ncbi:class I SAM-dependent methyltransferase [Lacisediminihabitans changchengi]|uniref:Class I SAM-dependent methyltransferase n=1 Tax=Lacisediminihabitans changchengi TaxID=2787634 RepID=A0A934SJF1_9MICO|nr:class I SAM-dependent methyltransferase [Lacisediminihabitans changchengi]MBK4346464.1 class I SAM-dependent methyltransferase [Lacisediminihabitans changchengi]MBK4348908.1 class I SAM-dependent methyltransferase [Lacisediminihabitans changchengi]
MVAVLVWESGSAHIVCPVCRYDGDASGDVAVLGMPVGRIETVRCPRCRSISILGGLFSINTPESIVDAYVENGAGLEGIARNLYYIDPAQVSTMLDVGCNYGFGAHLGKTVLGWDAMGIEPGTSGRRGARELGIVIRDEFLLKETRFDSAFDLIVASEVLEHVPDPLGFLQAIAAHLSPTGRLILTTPAAEIVSPDEPDVEIIIALSPGYHLFLASSGGLEMLLREAGFGAVRIELDGRTLRAIAAIDSSEPVEFGDFGPDPSTLERYYDQSAELGPAGSALRSGMATRHFRSLVNRGAWEIAGASRDRAISAVSDRHGVDLASPTSALAALHAGTPVPWNSISLAYHCGMRELVDRNDAPLALQYFDFTLGAAALWVEQANVLDGDSSDLMINAARHRALALARFDPDALPAALSLLSTVDSRGSADVWTARILTELVSLARFDAAESIRADAEALVARSDGQTGGRTVPAIRSVFALADMDIASRRFESAASRLRLARQLRGRSATDDETEAFIHHVLVPSASERLGHAYRAALAAKDHATARQIARTITEVARIGPRARLRRSALVSLARFPAAIDALRLGRRL